MKRLIILSLVLSFTNSIYALSGSGTQQYPYLIQSLADFDEFAGDANYWNDYIRLETDINLGGRTYTTAVIAYDTNESSSGFQGTSFTGSFDGNSKKIMNLGINTAGAGNDYLGLFGGIHDSAAQIKNLGVANAVIAGGIDSKYLGGLCGYNNGTVSNCYASRQVTGGSGSYYLGGLCGYNNSQMISNCYATGQVTSGYDSYYFGGLCGYNNHGIISNCYASSQVQGGLYSYILGGLCGWNYSGTINNCYATGSVSGEDYLGGLCGYNWGTISNCYSTGRVTGGQYRGGFCSSNNGTVASCFWDTQTSGMTTSSGGTGKTTIQMKTQSTFTDAGWDFVDEIINGSNDIWAICAGTNYPKLVWQIPAGDFVCPEGVDIFDLAELCEQWLLLEIPADLAPPPAGDGIVNFADFSVFAEQWGITNDIYDLLDFSQQWLKTGLQFCSADIAPAPDGDGRVDEVDFALMAENWLYGMN
jgi:hypothetical protein